MSEQPTELQRARWWRSGWSRSFDKAGALDQPTILIARREIESVFRCYKATLMAEQDGKEGAE